MAVDPAVVNGLFALGGAAVGSGAPVIAQWGFRSRDERNERERRLFDHKREAYHWVLIEYNRLHAQYAAFVWGGGDVSDPTLWPPRDFGDEMRRRTEELDMFGSARAADSAVKLPDLVEAFVRDESEDTYIAMETAVTEFKNAVREDLGVSEPLAVRPLET